MSPCGYIWPVMRDHYADDESIRSRKRLQFVRRTQSRCSGRSPRFDGGSVGCYSFGAFVR